MKKTLLSLITITFFLCEASFTGGGIAFATPASLGNGVTWEISGTTLTIGYTGEGSGEMPNTWSKDGAPWYSSRASITTIVIKDGATSIGKNAFYNCSAATIVQISSTVTSIGTDAFYGCSALTRVNYRKNNMNSSNKTTVAAWAQITFANDKANPLYYAHRLYYVGQNGQSSYGLIENTGPTLGATVKAYALVNCTTMTTVTIPNTTTAIGNYAFSGCTGLRTVTFNGTSQVASIGEYAFNGCNNAQFTSITIPESVTSVGTRAFLGCTNLTTVNWNARNCADFTYTSGQYTSYTTPFYYNSSNHMTEKIQTLNFGSNVEHIPAYLCQGMTNANLTSVTIPASVTSVGTSAFSGCTKLTSVNYLGSIAQWCGITFASSASNPLYVGKNLKLNGSNFSTLDIPSGVASIGTYQFYNAQNVTTLNIPTSVTYVGTEAFKGCLNITSVNYAGSAADWSRINFSVTNEGTCPLYYGEDMLFCNGSKPTSVVVPSGVTKISPYAFYKCTSLTSVTLNDDGSLTQIMNNAFRGCTGLTEIIVPNSVTSIGADAFNACTGLTSLTLGSSLININSSAFNGCTSLAGTLTIPSAVTQISSYAFKNCSSLTALDLTNASALKTISSSSFTGCTNIVGDLYIPAAVTKIENNAFEDLSGITAIFATPTTAPTAYAATFTNMVKTIPFYVLTSDALTSYSGSDKWNVFTNMKIGGCCGATGNETNVLWELNPSTGLLTISGTGEMKDYSSSSTNHAPWYDLRTSVKSIKICDGVTHVGKYAFNNCSNATEVWMSTTVTECGNSAFLGCSSLNNVKYGKTSTPTLSYATNWAQIDFGNYSANPLSFAHSLQVYKPTNTMPVWETVIGFENRSITSIKKFAFYGCTSLTSATLPSDVETIEESAFYGCTQLETVTLPDALTTIGKEAFKNCSKLPSITIPENVTVMTCHNGSTTYSIFGGCANLTTIVWNARNCASDYIKVGTGSGYNYGTPFSGIYSQITSITFGENVERIPNYLCYHMDHLTSVTIPASVTNIGTEAFDACSGTMSVICEGATPPTLASGVFSSSSTKKLYLPHDIDIKAAYRAASGWSSFTEANTFPKIVQFDLNGQTAIDPQFFDNTTSKASAPSDPADDGYFVFDKWCSDEEGESPFNFASMNITADMTLFAKWGLNGTLALSETDDNSTKLSDYNGSTVDVNLTRSLTNAQYNTFCLPFSLSASQMITAFGEGYDLEELTDVTYDGEVLGLVFTQREALEAGKPYLLQPANNVSNPSFTGVEIDASTPSDGLDNTFIEFHGVYSPTELTGGNKNLLFLGAGNELFWPSSTGDLKGFRAYFEVKGSAQKAVRARIVKKEDTATGIDQIINDQLPITNKFLRNGELLILRDGKTYNAQGMLVE